MRKSEPSKIELDEMSRQVMKALDYVTRRFNASSARRGFRIPYHRRPNESVYEAPVSSGVLESEQAIDCATGRAAFARARFGFSTRLAGSNAPFRSTRQIECCDRATAFWSNVSFELPGIVEPIC